MKSTQSVLAFVFILGFTFMKAQDIKSSKFNIIAFGGIGYVIVKNEKQPNYNLNANSAEILLNYRINQKFGIATGIGMNELSGSGFNSSGNFYNEKTLLKIPLLATMDYKISENLKMIGNFGIYSQTSIKEEYLFLSNSQKDVFKGWNFGTQLGLGFVFKIYDGFNAGINYSVQSDLSNLKSNNDSGLNDKQALKNMNSVGIILSVDL